MTERITEMLSREWVGRVLALLILAVAACWIVYPIYTTGGWWKSHDGVRYPYLSYRFLEALKEGILYPRWMPELNGGYGYPTFVFYQPGYFYFTAPFVWLFDAVHGTWLALAAMFMLGGYGAFRLARAYGISAVPAAFLGVLYLLSPYIWPALIVRDVLAEVFTATLLPWGFVAAKTFSEGGKWQSFMGLAFWTLAITISHPFITFFFLPVLALYALVLPRRVQALIAIFLGFVLAAPYWVPILQLSSEVTGMAHMPRSHDPLYTLTPLWDFLLGKEWWRQNALPFLLAAIVGFVLARKRPEVCALAAVYAFYLFLPSKEARFIWEWGYPVLRYIQFTYRLGAAVTVLEFLAIVQLVSWVWLRLKGKWRCVGIAALGAAVVAAAVVLPYRVPRPMPDYYAMMREQEKKEFYTGQATGEFVPLTMNTRGLVNRFVERIPSASLSGFIGNNILEISPESSHFHYIMTAKLSRADTLTINQMYFPGWKVQVNGREIPWSREGEDPPDMAEGAPFGTIEYHGLMRVLFPEKGEYTIEAWYDGPPGWQERNLLIILVTALLLCAAYMTERKLRPAKDSPTTSAHDDRAPEPPPAPPAPKA